MSDYKYTSPIDRGYIQFNLTNKQHNELFKNRQVRWTDKYEYYYNEDQIILHKFYSWKAVLYTTLLFPVIVLLNGILSFKEVWKEVKDMYNQKQTGLFISEHIWKTQPRYIEIMDIIKNK